MLSSGSEFNNSIDIRISSHESLNVNKFFFSLIFSESRKSKFTRWAKLRLSLCLQETSKWLGKFIKKVIYVMFWLNTSSFYWSVNELRFSRIQWTNRRFKDAIFGGNVEKSGELFVVMVSAKCVPLHYTKFPTKQLIRHKFWKTNSSNVFKKKQQKYKKLGQKQNKRPETRLSQTRPRLFFLIVIVNENIAQYLFIFLISLLAPTHNFSKKFPQKNWRSW